MSAAPQEPTVAGPGPAPDPALAHPGQLRSSAARPAPGPPRPGRAVRVGARLVVLVAAGLVILAVANVTAAAQRRPEAPAPATRHPGATSPARP